MSSSIITCTRIVEFDAGHRILRHEGKCAAPHGHRYQVHLQAQAEDHLDSIGRVIDFGVLKECVGGWIDDQWDHGFILSVEDKLVDVLVPFGKVYVMQRNPTAENIADYLLREVCPPLLRKFGVEVVRVTV